MEGAGGGGGGVACVDCCPNTRQKAACHTAFVDGLTVLQMGRQDVQTQRRVLEAVVPASHRPRADLPEGVMGAANAPHWGGWGPVNKRRRGNPELVQGGRGEFLNGDCFGSFSATKPPPCVTFRRVVVPLRGPGQSPVLPSACCVGSLLSVGRCGRCSCWCRFRVRGAQ